MTDDEKIELACSISEKIDDMEQQVNELLEGICAKALRSRDIETISILHSKLPRGFYKSELRAFLIRNGIN